jgi:hypothetical protein
MAVVARARTQKPSEAHLRSPCVLVIGAADRAEEFLAPLMTELASPVVYLDAANPTFPETPGGTVIVRNVEGLTPRDQHQFLDWLNAQRELGRVVAISSRNLFPRVQRGAFCEQLYYRLNTVIVELKP